MKFFSTLITFLFCFSSFAQVPELIKASDKAQKKIAGDDIPKISFDPSKYVNPFIGTGGHGHTFPGPVLPFGMIQVGPDTRQGNWDACGGYHYDDSLIYGFSHTHLSGVGVEDYADLLLVPLQGKLKLDPLYKSKNGYGASFSHKNESAQPGFYSVKLNNGIQVKLTATERCAIHSYTFSDKSAKKYILIDLDYRDKVLDFKAQKLSSKSVSGMRVSEAWAREQHFYFYLETSVDFKNATLKTNPKNGRKVMILEFDKSVQTVEVKVGISGTNEMGAKGNFDAEVKNKDFNTVFNEATQTWKTELSKIAVTSKNNTVLTNFYSAFYHTLIHPSLWSDVDGKFRTFDNKIETASTKMYSVFSLWDTYRAAHPLYTISHPEMVPAFANSFLSQYKVTGRMPMWPLSNNETYCMIGYHSASVLADAQAKGIEFDKPEELLAALVQSAKFNELGKTEYGTQGFISAGKEAESVSKTLEYAYDDWCIARFAESIGNSEIQKEFDLRASSWMNIFNPESRFFQPRNSGMWLNNFKPNEINHHYTEANAWQYSLAVPQNINGLITLKGGKRSMETFLDSLFTTSSKMAGREQADVTGLIGQYAHGNEPSHHMAYLYNYVGNPAKTQAIVDEILQKFYLPTPDGLVGNEDCGQMSAWYVFSALGFYPVCPGSPNYAFGRPLIDQGKIKIGEKEFVISVQNNSESNKYIQLVKWNNQEYKKLFITHEMLKEGGLLEITMGSSPNSQQSNYENDATEMNSANFVPVPNFDSPNAIFPLVSSVTIETLPNETGEIFYSINNGDYNLYAGQKLSFTSTTELKAKVVRKVTNQTFESKVVSTVFKKFEQDKSIRLDCLWENHYSANGMQSLVDGERGKDEYRNAEWQGFLCPEVSGVVELNSLKTIQKVSLSALQDCRSWIYLPSSFEVEYSIDGKIYKKLGSIKANVDGQKTPNCTRELTIEVPPTEVKFIRFKAKNFGKNPEWHISPGGKTWMFIDELIIE